MGRIRHLDSFWPFLEAASLRGSTAEAEAVTHGGGKTSSCFIPALVYSLFLDYFSGLLLVFPGLFPVCGNKLVYCWFWFWSLPFRGPVESDRCWSTLVAYSCEGIDCWGSDDRAKDLHEWEASEPEPGPDYLALNRLWFWWARTKNQRSPDSPAALIMIVGG